MCFDLVDGDWDYYGVGHIIFRGALLLTALVNHESVLPTGRNHLFYILFLAALYTVYLSMNWPDTGRGN